MNLLLNLNCLEGLHTSFHRSPYKLAGHFPWIPQYRLASPLMPPRSQDHYRTALNNAAQAYGWTVTYETSSTGPQNSPLWTAISYVNNIEYGRGNAGSRGAAKETAAYEALIATGVMRRP
ncbi:hypothetical protein C8R45DRAFT_1120493 [Mycena sanguinolenta]|nr:hypothetical protein C8R45DRAFT_1120493 [Mycena sanguinolenta]